jgi:hypothetical protein
MRSTSADEIQRESLFIVLLIIYVLLIIFISVLKKEIIQRRNSIPTFIGNNGKKNIEKKLMKKPVC